MIQPKRDHFTWPPSVFTCILSCKYFYDKIKSWYLQQKTCVSIGCSQQVRIYWQVSRNFLTVMVSYELNLATTCPGLVFRAPSCVYCFHTLACIISLSLSFTQMPINSSLAYSTCILWGCNSLFFFSEYVLGWTQSLSYLAFQCLQANLHPLLCCSGKTGLLVLFLIADNDTMRSRLAHKPIQLHSNLDQLIILTHRHLQNIFWLKMEVARETGIGGVLQV